MRRVRPGAPPTMPPMWIASAAARLTGWMLATGIALALLQGQVLSWSTGATAGTAYLLITCGRALRDEHLARQMAHWEAIGENAARRRRPM